MPQPSRSSSRFTLTRTMVWVLIGGYSLILVGKSTYENYTLNHEITAQQQQVVQLEQTKQAMDLMLSYYQSSAYKEMEARRRLNLKGQGEHVVALPSATTEPKIITSLTNSTIEAQKPTAPLSPAAAWWELLFGKQ